MSKRKLLSLLLVFSMCLSLIPTWALADDFDEAAGATSGNTATIALSETISKSAKVTVVNGGGGGGGGAVTPLDSTSWTKIITTPGTDTVAVTVEGYGSMQVKADAVTESRITITGSDSNALTYTVDPAVNAGVYTATFEPVAGVTYTISAPDSAFGLADGYAVTLPAIASNLTSYKVKVGADDAVEVNTTTYSTVNGGLTSVAAGTEIVFSDFVFGNSKRLKTITMTGATSGTTTQTRDAATGSYTFEMPAEDATFAVVEEDDTFLVSKAADAATALGTVYLVDTTGDSVSAISATSLNTTYYIIGKAATGWNLTGLTFTYDEGSNVTAPVQQNPNDGEITELISAVVSNSVDTSITVANTGYDGAENEYVIYKFTTPATYAAMSNIQVDGVAGETTDAVNVTIADITGGVITVIEKDGTEHTYATDNSGFQVHVGDELTVKLTATAAGGHLDPIDSNLAVNFTAAVAGSVTLKAAQKLEKPACLVNNVIAPNAKSYEWTCTVGQAGAFGFTGSNAANVALTPEAYAIDADMSADYTNVTKMGFFTCPSSANTITAVTAATDIYVGVVAKDGYTVKGITVTKSGTPASNETVSTDAAKVTAVQAVPGFANASVYKIGSTDVDDDMFIAPVVEQTNSTLTITDNTMQLVNAVSTKVATVTVTDEDGQAVANGAAVKSGDVLHVKIEVTAGTGYQIATTGITGAALAQGDKATTSPASTENVGNGDAGASSAAGGKPDTIVRALTSWEADVVCTGEPATIAPTFVARTYAVNAGTYDGVKLYFAYDAGGGTTGALISKTAPATGSRLAKDAVVYVVAVPDPGVTLAGAAADLTVTKLNDAGESVGTVSATPVNDVTGTPWSHITGTLLSSQINGNTNVKYYTVGVADNDLKIDVNATVGSVNLVDTTTTAEKAKGGIAFYSDEACTSPITAAAIGSTVYIKVEPNSGYELGALTATPHDENNNAGVAVPLTGTPETYQVSENIWKFTAEGGRANADLDFAATFTAQKYSLNWWTTTFTPALSAEPVVTWGGSNHTRSIPTGETVYIKPTASGGYTVEKVTYTPEGGQETEMGKGQTGHTDEYVITAMPAKNVTVKVYTKAESVKAVPAASTLNHGTITLALADGTPITESTDIEVGSTVVMTIAPDSGYEQAVSGAQYGFVFTGSESGVKPTTVTKLDDTTYSFVVDGSSWKAGESITVQNVFTAKAGIAITSSWTGKGTGSLLRTVEVTTYDASSAAQDKIVAIDNEAVFATGDTIGHKLTDVAVDSPKTGVGITHLNGEWALTINAGVTDPIELKATWVGTNALIDRTKTVSIQVGDSVAKTAEATLADPTGVAAAQIGKIEFKITAAEAAAIAAATPASIAYTFTTVDENATWGRFDTLAAAADTTAAAKAETAGVTLQPAADQATKPAEYIRVTAEDGTTIGIYGVYIEADAAATAVDFKVVNQVGQEVTDAPVESVVIEANTGANKATVDHGSLPQTNDYVWITAKANAGYALDTAVYIYNDGTEDVITPLDVAKISTDGTPLGASNSAFQYTASASEVTVRLTWKKANVTATLYVPKIVTGAITMPTGWTATQNAYDTNGYTYTNSTLKIGDTITLPTFNNNDYTLIGWYNFGGSEIWNTDTVIKAEDLVESPVTVTGKVIKLLAVLAPTGAVLDGTGIATSNSVYIANQSTALANGSDWTSSFDAKAKTLTITLIGKPANTKLKLANFITTTALQTIADNTTVTTLGSTPMKIKTTSGIAAADTAEGKRAYPVQALTFDGFDPTAAYTDYSNGVTVTLYNPNDGTKTAYTVKTQAVEKAGDLRSAALSGTYATGLAGQDLAPTTGIAAGDTVTFTKSSAANKYFLEAKVVKKSDGTLFTTLKGDTLSFKMPDYDVLVIPDYIVAEVGDAVINDATAASGSGDRALTVAQKNNKTAIGTTNGNASRLKTAAATPLAKLVTATAKTDAIAAVKANTTAAAKVGSLTDAQIGALLSLELVPTMDTTITAASTGSLSFTVAATYVLKVKANANAATQAERDLAVAINSADPVISISSGNLKVESMQLQLFAQDVFTGTVNPLYVKGANSTYKGDFGSTLSNVLTFTTNDGLGSFTADSSVASAPMFYVGTSTEANGKWFDSFADAVAEAKTTGAVDDTVGNRKGVVNVNATGAAGLSDEQKAELAKEVSLDSGEKVRVMYLGTANDVSANGDDVAESLLNITSGGQKLSPVSGVYTGTTDAEPETETKVDASDATAVNPTDNTQATVNDDIADEISSETEKVEVDVSDKATVTDVTLGEETTKAIQDNNVTVDVTTADASVSVPAEVLGEGTATSMTVSVEANNSASEDKAEDLLATKTGEVLSNTLDVDVTVTGSTAKTSDLENPIVITYNCVQPVAVYYIDESSNTLVPLANTEWSWADGVLTITVNHLTTFVMSVESTDPAIVSAAKTSESSSTTYYKVNLTGDLTDRWVAQIHTVGTGVNAVVTVLPVAPEDLGNKTTTVGVSKSKAETVDIGIFTGAPDVATLSNLETGNDTLKSLSELLGN